MEVTLEQVLSARERRAEHQYILHRKYRRTILSFTMNIPGPVKDTPLIRRAFQIGLCLLESGIPRSAILELSIIREVTGCEALFALDLDALELKKFTSSIEDSHPLGRLFDLDVLDEHMAKLDREAVGYDSRGCIVCGKPGRSCASRRVHPVNVLQNAVQRKMLDYFQDFPDFHTIGTWAAASLLDEVSVTPKPGLVDRYNSGSHRDMDISTFLSSTQSLVPYFRRCAEIGWKTRLEAPEETFRQLRSAGIEAEQAMFLATRGVNTHKGAIFTLGILCGAAGRLWSEQGKWQSETMLQTASDMTRDLLEAELCTLSDSTAGGRLFRTYGIPGIRGEAAQGFPSLAKIALPVLHNCLDAGMDYNQSGSVVLLHLIAQVEDTNMISRGGLSLAAEAKEKAASVLPCPTEEQLIELDQWFRERNLSPGGCADLLAAACFVRRLITH